MVSRALKHALLPPWVAQRPFPARVLKRIEQAIAASERRHRGELRFAAEGPLALRELGYSTRQRARAVFAQLDVWDTEENTGVLIYVQLVDRAIEIVADRGIAARVAQSEWDEVCRAMQARFRRDEYLEGSLEAIEAVTRILARHFPPRGDNPNELPDKPVML
ncbi:MAG TPA: DUF5130 family protein [Burkholderiales bacterium]|nr:DUF5130 family protein [Burkholderiales bacterium]